MIFLLFHYVIMFSFSHAVEFGKDDGDLEFNAAQEFNYDGDTSLFEDEETQQFYENLLDLRAIVPQILLKDAASQQQSSAEKKTPTDTESADSKPGLRVYSSQL